jgi:hypothetical protein
MCLKQFGDLERLKAWGRLTLLNLPYPPVPVLIQPAVVQYRLCHYPPPNRARLQNEPPPAVWVERPSRGIVVRHPAAAGGCCSPLSVVAAADSKDGLSDVSLMA